MRPNADRVTASSLQFQYGISQNGLSCAAVARAKVTAPKTPISDVLRQGLGVRRALRLSRLVRETQLPPEPLLDLALDLLEALSRHVTPGTQRAVGLATERWKRWSAQERSDALRQVAQVRWDRRGTEDTEPPRKHR